ncbi:MAG TPA: LamG-like jellyroll fold domain-containing protein [Longimicrobium sp.]|nr:LamG-like jellyroll fold domain-containing protein [Longimicrobium sp.]
MALSLTWGGRADTNIAFSEFFAANHTVAARFMLQFVNVYAGPMLAVHGSGVYSIGNGDGGGGDNKLLVRIGTGSLDVPISASFKEAWHHIAVVRSGTTCTVYLDGVSKGTLTISSSGNPSGTIRLGRSDEIHQQFYGFLDDVAVFKAALSASQVASLAGATTLTGTEPNLLAGFVFGDGPGGSLPATLTRAVTYVPGARNVTVSANRNNAADRALLPLSLVSHMRLPFAQGQIASVGQGFGDETISHNGYAAFCYDFGFPNSDIDGYVFKASAPGAVAHVWEGGPNTSAGPSNFVTIEQGGGEFCDYLHLQQNSCVVNAGQTVQRGTDLAKVGRSGTGGPHLHQAVTNLGEHTTDREHFVTIPFPFCNYEYSSDSGASWHHAIRGYLKKGQWVRNGAPRSPVRYTAAWGPGTSGEFQIYDAPYAAYRARYDELWPKGWRLHSLSIVVVNDVPLYTAVWRPGTGGEFQIYGATYAAYRARYDELWPQGWRLKLLTLYVIDGQIRYTAAWAPGTGGEFQIYDATYAAYRARYDELWPQGWRLKLIDVVNVNGEARYTAAWGPSSVGERQIYGATFQQFKAHYDELWPQGWRLRFLSTWNSGEARITAVWRQPQEPEIWVHGWEYADLRARYDVLWQQGWRLKVLDRFTV